MTQLGRDLRIAARGLRKSPGFAAVAAVTLALGIGGTTAIFSVLDAVVLRPLPYAEPERLVRIWSAWEGAERADVSPAEYFDYREQGAIKGYDPVAYFTDGKPTPTG